MPTQSDQQLNIDDMLVVTIRVRVAGFPTHWKRRADGGGYTLDNQLAREICEQELEINLGPDEELILVLNEMADAVQYDRLYGWMAQYRANLALRAGEIAPDAKAHLHSISHEIAASLKQSASQSPDETRPQGAQDPAQAQSPELDLASATAADEGRETHRRRRSRSPASPEAAPPTKARRRKTPKGAE